MSFSSEHCYGVELHTHLEGSMTHEIVFNAAKRNGKPLPSDVTVSSDLIPYISIDENCVDLKAFLDKFYFFFPYVVDDKIAMQELCLSFAENQYLNHVYYTEVRYCPHLMCGSKLKPSELTEIIVNALDIGAKKYNIIIKSILTCMRKWKGDQTAKELIEIAHQFQPHVVGVDLGGNEMEADAMKWKDVFSKAKNEYNLNITIHAGEVLNSYQNVYDAIHHLFATRIGHGYDAIQDDALIQLLKQKDICLEVCPSSSVLISRTGGIKYQQKDWTSHPIRRFHDLGLNYNISSDDPTILRCSYQSDLEIMRTRCGISKQDIAQSIMQSAKFAFCEDLERIQLTKEIEKRVRLYYLKEEPDLFLNAKTLTFTAFVISVGMVLYRVW
eukprot:414136_1